MPFTYVPLLRTKAGDIEAISRLSPTSKNRIFPVFHITEKVSPSVQPKLSRAVAGSSIGLDGLFNFQHTGNGSDFLQLFFSLKSAGVNLLPSVEVNSNPNYVSLVRGLFATAAANLIVKVKLSLLHHLRTWLSIFSIDSRFCHLIVEAGHLEDVDALLYGTYVNSHLTAINPAEWLSITLSGSSAPKDYSTLTLGVNLLPRKEWALWNNVHQLHTFPLHYADYCTVHPDLSEPPGPAMARASVSVRYSIDLEWIIIKGVAMSGPHGQPMPIQYKSHARHLIQHHQFNQLIYCTADDDIRRIAATASGPNAGSRGTWVRIGIERHLALICDRLP